MRGQQNIKICSTVDMAGDWLKSCLNYKLFYLFFLSGATAPSIDTLYHTETTILGFLVTSTVQESARNCWSGATAHIRAQAQEAYYRDLTLDKRINYIHD